MQNIKKQIQTLKDNSELAWAAYGYFHLANESYKPEENSKDWKRLKYFRNIKEDTTQSVFPTLIDILNIEYKYFKDEKTGKLKDGLFDDELFSGDFSPLQATIPKAQYDDMINFYETCIKDYPQIKEKDSLTITGHSLGGCLAQLFALSICDDKNRNNIKALYTYNAPGARKIIPPYDYIVKFFIFHSKEQQERFIKEEIENIANRARDLGKDNIFLESKIRKILHKIIQEKQSQYYGIIMSISTHTTMMTLDINAIPILADIAPYYRQLAYNNIESKESA